jgi:hypothetical protein
MSVTAWAYTSAFVSGLTYFLIVYTSIGRTLFAGGLFGLHLLSAIVGVLFCIRALWSRRLACLPALLVCLYILLFQLTSLVPSPQMLMHPGPPTARAKQP